MKLAVSNIAWTNEEEAEVARLLQSLGVKYIEVAPTKRWKDPTTEASDEDLVAYKAFWGSYGIEIVAFQSMLFNRPDLKIFEESTRSETLGYLENFITLAPKLGAGIMVFGSPKNRQHEELTPEATETIGKDFFAKIGEAAAESNITFCIEPNPTAYACDFVTTAQEGIDFVRKVDFPGFGLHLDIAGMTLAGDDVVESIKDAKGLMKHFHISAPYLEQVEDREDVKYRESAQALREIGYDGYVSIEMKPGDAGANLARVEKAVRFAQSVYNS
jgi:D-psicose/D-tagatose/L-ribulose 3-epimerase